MMIHVVHLEHVTGHDKSYRTHAFAGTAAYWYGKRGAAGAWSVKDVSEPARTCVDQQWAKRHKGYRVVFAMTIEGPDALPATVAARAAFVETVDREWARRTLEGPEGGGGWITIKDWETVARSQPYLAHAVTQASSSIDVIDSTLLARIVTGGDVAELAGVFASISGHQIGVCPESATYMNNPDVASLAVRLWNPSGDDELADFAVAAEAANNIAG